MASFDYGLNLVLNNHEAFKNQAKDIDKVFNSLAETVENVAKRIGGVNFGNLKIDLSGLTGIRKGTLEDRAAGLEKVAKAYANLGTAVKGVDAGQISAINKAFQGGAQSKTLASKADGLKAFVDQAKKLKDLPDLGKVGTQIRELLESFASSTTSLQSFTGFATIAKDVGKLVTTFQKIGKIEVSKQTLLNLETLTLSLGRLGGPEAQKALSILPPLAAGFNTLFKAVRSLSTGPGIAQIPAVLGSVTSTISSLIKEIQALNNTGKSGSGVSTVITQLNSISEAFRNLGIAIRSYGAGAKGVNVFADIDKNIQLTIDSFHKLINAFKDPAIGGNISTAIVPATTAIKELGEAFETLGRKKGFKDFPATIALINTAITSLNTTGLEALSKKIAASIPALKELAEVAKAVSIVNSQAGKAFVQAAKAKGQDQAANNQLKASYIQLAASIINILPGIKSLISALVGPLVSVIKSIASTVGGPLVTAFRNLALAFLALPFKIVQAGFVSLRAVFVTLPLKTIELGVSGVSNAFKILGTVLNAPFNVLRSVGTFVRDITKDLRLMETGLNALLFPFKALYSLLSSIVGIIGNVASGFGRLVGVISPIGKAATDSARGLKDTVDVQKNVATAFRGAGQATSESAQQLQNYNGQVQNTNRFARVAVGGLQLFAGALVAKGVTTAVSRLVSMHIAFKTLDTLSRAASSGLTFFSNALTGLVGQAFNAAAEFQRLQISISVLLGREQVQLNPGMFKDTLEAAKQMSGESDRLLKQFQLLAVASPFTTTDIAEGFRMAQVYGFSAKEAEKLTNATVDLAAGLGLSGFEIAGIIQPLGQMQQVGRANLQDLKQLASRGVPVFEVLAKEFGVTTERLRDMISDGVIPADRAINAIVESFGKDFKGAAAASTRSLSGLLSTAQDLRATSLREFFTPIFEAVLFAKNEGDFSLADMLSIENLETTIANAKRFGQAIAVDVNIAFQKAVTFIRAFVNIVREIPAPVIATVTNIAKFVAIVGSVVLGLGILNTAIVAATATFFLFVNPISIVIGVLVALGLAVTKNSDIIFRAVNDVFASFGQISEFVTALSTSLDTFFKTGEVGTTAFDGLTSTLQGLGSIILNTISLATRLGEGLLTAFSTLSATGQASTSGFDALPTVLRVIATEVFNSINALSTFISYILDLPATIGGVATTIGSGFQTLLGEFVDWGANIVGSFADGIAGTVGLIGKALEAVGGILTFWLAPGSPPKIAPNLDSWGALAALEFVNNFVNTFTSSLGEGFSAIGAAAVTLIGGTFANAVGSLVIVLTGVFKSVSSLMVGIGTQVFITVQAIGEVLLALADTTTTAKEKIQAVLNALGYFIQNTFVNIGQTIGGVASGILLVLSGVATFIGGEFVVAFLALGKIAPIFTDTANAILNFASDADSAIRGFGDGIVDYIGNIFVDVTDYGYGLVESFADGIIAAVSVVADALSAIGNEISYWLAPGSPPRILPDIDQWGTDAAGEFLQGFTKADFDTIGDFGNTVQDLLKNLDVEGVDTEKIVEQFAGGLANINAGGDFGQGTLDQIHFLAGEAGTEVAVLAEKYVQLAKEQAVLNDVTKRYDAQLQEVQGTLDNIERTSGIETNTAKIESLTNALSNNLLSENERTRIQTQIQKLQAESRLKQLEAEKNAQERNTGTAKEALDLQKEQLNLADQFDQTGTTIAGGAQDALSSATDKAAKAQDRLTEAQLKYKLEATDTAGKIAILREELNKVEEGSVEYYKILTQIDKLEEQLGREREAAAKKETAASNKALTEQEKVEKAQRDYNLSVADTAGKLDIWRAELDKVEKGSAEYYQILTKVTDLEKQLAKESSGGPTGLFANVTNGLSTAETNIGDTVKNVNKKIEEMQTNISNQFTAIKDNIKFAVDTVKGYLDQWIFKNDIVKASLAALGVVFAGIKIVGGIAAIGSALALLSNPLVAIAAGVIALGAAFAFFAVKSGGITDLVDTIREKFSLLKSSISIGASSGNGLDLDFTSFESAIITLGTNIGAFATTLGTSISTFFTNLVTNFQNGFLLFSTNIQTLFSTGWTTLTGLISGIFGSFGENESQLTTASTNVQTSILDSFITPITNAFNENGTFLGKISAVLLAFYTSFATLLYTKISEAFATISTIDVKAAIDDFFTNNALAATFESNINEVVGNIIPVLKDKFDLSTTLGEVATGVQTAITNIGNAFSNIGTVFQPLIDGFNAVKGAFTGEEGGILSNILNENKEAFNEFITEVTSPAFIEGLTNIGKLLGIVVGAIAAVAAVIIDVALIGLLKNIGDLVIEVGAGVGTLFEAFDLFIQGDILGGFGKVFEGLVQIFDGVFGNIADVIADAVKALLEFFGIDTSGPLGTLIQFVADTVVQFFAFNGILGILGKGWSLLVAAFNKGKAIFAIVTGLFTGTSVSAGVFQKVLGGIQTAIGFVVKKFFTLTAGFLAVKKAFEDTGKNLSGIFENIKSNVTQKFTEIKTNISDSIANFFSGSEVVAQGILFVGKFFTGFLSGLDPKLALSRDGITSGLGLIDLSAVGSAIMSTLGIDSEEIKTALTTKAKALFVSVFTGVKDIAFNIADAIIVTEEQEQALADKISSYLPNLDVIFGEGATEGFALNLADLVTIDTEELDNLKLKFDGLLTILNKFVDVPALGKVFTDAFDTLASFFKGEASLSTTVDGLLDILKDFVNVLPLPQGFKDILTALVGIFTGESSLNTLLDTFKRILGDIYTTLLQAFTNPFTTFIQPIKDLLAPTEGVSNAFTAIKDAITGLLDIDLSGFASIFSPITDTFADLQQKADALVNGIKGLNIIPGFNIGGAEITGGDEVQQKIKSTVGSQTLDINQKLQIITDDDNIAEQSKKLLDAFLASYKENTGLGGYGATDFAAINKDLIEQGFTAADIETLATSFGKEVPTGLAAGMADESGELDRATRGLATNLLSDIASELGIESPSTEARDEIGIPFVQGIAAGLEDKTSIIAALEALVEAMFSTVAASLNKNAATIDIAKSLFSFNEATVSITKASLDSILKVHDETFNTITNDSIPTFAENFEESFVDLFDTILDLAEEFAGEFLRVIEELNTSVITALGNLITKITGLTSSFKTAGKALGEAIMKGIIEGIEENIAAVVGAINNLFGEDGIESTETFKKAKESGIKIGKEITKGVAEGMIAPDVLVILREAAQKLIEEAQQAVEQAAGIESPSTLFRNYVGRNITSGISLGMIDGIRDLLISARTVVSEVYTVARDNVGSMFTQGIQDGINSQQTALNTTITSLLDTSVTTAKTALDINSPSGVTYEGVGVPYIDGIITALSDGKGRLSSVAGSLLDVLPSGKNFDYSMNVAKQPVELQYRNLLTSLPSLTQSINLANSGNGSYRHNVGGVLNTYEMMKMQSMQMQNISNMTDSRRSMVSNSNVYHYEMHVNTTPEKSTRVAHNFDMMRVGRKI